jgi:Tfp pilus assembly protein PilF
MRIVFLFVLTLLISASLSLVPGCASKQGEDGPYDTLGEAPGRDTDRARQLNERAFTQLKKKHYDKAKRTLERALDADVMFGPAHNNLGKVFYHQDRLYRAAWEFQYAIKLMPDQPEPKNNLGLVFEKAGKLDKALKHYQEAHELAPDNAQMLGNLTRAKLRLGEKDQKLRKWLDALIMKDDRKRWTDWAREQRALLSDED